MYQLRFEGLTPAEVDSRVGTLAADSRVEYAVRELLTPPNPGPQATPASRAEFPVEFDVDGDGNRDDAWDEQNPGGTNWHLGVIRAPTAWDTARGSLEASRIAVIDTWFTPSNPDLSGAIVSCSYSGSATSTGNAALIDL